ncbi:acetyl-CoA carboxylase biotin carboxyl carrier protein [Isobaculum melis]|uniref:Biotin carboxyl carrier protein of acetyl-CoA carboxylase n=1 Tax=Isobaculum melis TaxID=142588 RepID=A0A1H9TWS8_9LACT|nr:acetyl-CoA carboxylase biotin carboxyl carrier protein [Isobaculum melis]SES01502.1 biotin carboxyl carrier protein [Isobaculum melis]
MSSENKEQYFLSYEEIKELLEVFSQSEASELKLAMGDQKLKLMKASNQPASVVYPTETLQQPVAAPLSQVATTPVVEANVQPAEDPNLVEIKSEMVGTFYSKPTPDEEDYVHVGMNITPETTICMIEAMKLFNEVKSELSGQIAEVLVSNGQMVEYGQPLFKVRTNG